MKKVSGRARLVLVIACVVLAGLALFCIRYALYAEDWVVFSGNPHVYSGGNLSSGTVTDRNGTVLLTNTENGRVYADDALLRTSVLHLVGDREGYVSAPLINARADQMVAYSKVTGLSGSARTMTLTISAEAQTAALSALSGRKGCVAAYNYQTGEILCMVSSPAYDPDNKPEVDESDPAWDGVYVCRPTASAYTPGSIFKLVTLACALENLDGAEDLTFFCDGSCVIDGVTVTCHAVHGTVTLREALASSCNCAFGELAVMLGAEALQETADRLGINEALVTEDFAAVAGHFDVSEADDGALAWAGIGQYTDLVNPMRYLTVLGAIARDGTCVDPYLVRDISGVRKASSDGTERQLLSRDTAGIIADYMQWGVETVYGADAFGGLTVCAKTGTAEVGTEGDNAMFAGFVRDEELPVAFVIVVEGAGYGGQNCVPIAAAVLSALAEPL